MSRFLSYAPEQAYLLPPTLTPDFEQTIGDLLRLAEQSRTAHMCAERAHFGCQCMIVSDWLVGHGHEVLHIDAEGPTRPHRLTSEARMVDGRMIYRGSQLF